MIFKIPSPMLIESLPRDSAWETVAQAVFWSRKVELAAWRAGIVSGQRSYLPDSVSRMSTWHFVKFLGRTAFVEHWPVIRQMLPATHQGRNRLDVAWSLAATGKFNVPPESALSATRANSLQSLVALK